MKNILHELTYTLKKENYHRLDLLDAILNLLLIKILSEKKIINNINLIKIRNELIHSNSNEKLNYFLNNLVPTLQSDNIKDQKFKIIFKDFHRPFENLDVGIFCKLVGLIEEIDFNQYSSDLIMKTILTFDKYNQPVNIDKKIQESIINLLNIKEDDKVLDLNLFTSNFLVNLKNNNSKNLGFCLHEQELKLRIFELLLNDKIDTNIVLKNPLGEYHDNSIDNNFDIVFAIPPFGQRVSKEDYSIDFPIQSNNSENLYIQKALNSLNDTGKAAIIVPDGFLSTNKPDTIKIKQKILSNLVAVINFPIPLFIPITGISTSLLILKKDNLNDKVLFINFIKNKDAFLDEFEYFSNTFQDINFDLDYFSILDKTNHLLINKEKINKENYNFLYNKYRPIEEFEIQYDNPENIVNDLDNNSKRLIDNINQLKNTFTNINLNSDELLSHKLNEISDLKVGRRPLPRDEIIEEGNIPFLSISDITKCTSNYVESSENMISENFANNHNITVVKKNSILLSIRGTIGKVILTKGRVAINPNLVAFELNSSDVRPFIIYQWFKNKKHFLEANATGGSIKALSIHFLKELTIPLPPLEIQHKMESHQHSIENISNTINNLNIEINNLPLSIFSQYYKEKH